MEYGQMWTIMIQQNNYGMFWFKVRVRTNIKQC